jgi:hypothetical protein
LCTLDGPRCRSHEKRPPAVVGIELSELEAAAALYGKAIAAEGEQELSPQHKHLLRTEASGSEARSEIRVMCLHNVGWERQGVGWF